MDELIQKVSERAGINTDQAKKAVEAVADFVKTKFPSVGGQIDSLLHGGGGDVLGNIGKFSPGGSLGASTDTSPGGGVGSSRGSPSQGL